MGLGSEIRDPEKCYSASLVIKEPDPGSRTTIFDLNYNLGTSTKKSRTGSVAKWR
jgi:hypothetical protein